MKQNLYTLIKKQKNLMYSSPELKGPRFWIRALTGFITISGVGATAWLYFSYTEEIIQVRGVLEPVGEVKDVQSPIAGVIEDLAVREGQHVVKGQLLLTINNATSQSKVASLKASLLRKSIQLRLVGTELDSVIQKSAAELNVASSLLKSNEDIMNKIRTLKDQGAVAELQLIQQQDKVMQSKGDIQARISQMKAQTAAIRREYERLSAEKLQLEQQLVEETEAYSYHSIRAPEGGKVFDLKIKGRGYIVSSGMPLLKVVPNENLVARVDIPSAKIGFVQDGMSASISVDSFPATDYGVIDGVIKSIGVSALPPDPASGRVEFVYPGTISLKTQVMNTVNGKKLELYPGMSLSANIRLRRVRYIDLLVADLTEKTESLQKK